jgi:hypothetical protein
VENSRKRLKKADLASGVGAGILGVGLGVLLFKFLKPFTVSILIIGLFLHGWGMFEKHRLENESKAIFVWWSELLYWLCWIALLILVGYIIYKVVSS